MSFSFSNLIEDCTKPHDFREVMNRWGYVLYKNLDNRRLFLNRINTLLNDFNKKDFDHLLEDYEEFLDKFNKKSIKAQEPLKREVPLTPPKAEKRITLDSCDKDKQRIIDIIDSMGTMEELQKAYMCYVYAATKGNKSETARILNISVRTVRNRVV
jgi:DNA-binding NtrC family response regulator